MQHEAVMFAEEHRDKIQRKHFPAGEIPAEMCRLLDDLEHLATVAFAAGYQLANENRTIAGSRNVGQALKTEQ